MDGDENDLRQRKASPSLRRRAPVDQHRGSPLLNRRQVFFDTPSNESNEQLRHRSEEIVYSAVKTYSSHVEEGRQNVSNVEVGQNPRQGILKNGKFPGPKLMVSLSTIPQHAPSEFMNSGTNLRNQSGRDFQETTWNRSESLDRQRSLSVENIGPEEADELRRVAWEVRQSARNPNGHVEPKEASSTECAWAGTKLAGRVNDAKANGIKCYWEQNCKKEEEMKLEEQKRQRPKTYGFPKWRSIDALSASLVASNKVDIPMDSRIPEQRLQKMEMTEMEANQTRQMIQESVPPKRLSKGKSLESLTMQVDYTPWYDRQKIREAISRESIANIGQVRERFETGSIVNSRAPSTTPSSRFQTPVPIGMGVDKRIPNGRPNGSITPSLHGSTTALHQPAPSVNGGTVVGDSRQTNGVAHHSNPPPTNQPTRFPEPQPRSAHFREQSFPPNHSTPQPYHPPTHAQPALISHGNYAASPMGINLSVDEQLLLLYLRQNSEMIAGLGILIPDQIRCIMDDIPWRKVELKSTDEEAFSYTPHSYSPNQRNQGRYLKNMNIVQTNAPRFIKQKFEQNIQQQRIPENRRPSVQDTDGKTGESLIAAEIRQLREREDELRRSRSELGLPSLEESMELSRHGQRGVQQIQPNVLRSAVSYDHLHQMGVGFGDTNLSKTASIDHLSREDYDYKERKTSQNIEKPDTVQREYIGQRNVNFRPAYSATAYKLQRTDDQDVMIYGPPKRREPTVLQNRRFE